MKAMKSLFLTLLFLLVASPSAFPDEPFPAPQTTPEVLEHLRNIRLSNDNVERVKNGTFTGAATDWTLASGWAYSANTVVKNGAGAGALEQNVNAQAYEIWLVTATISNWTAGTTLTPSIGGVNGTAITGNASYSEYILTTGAGNLKFTPTTDVRATIDGVSAKRVDAAVIRNAAGAVTGWIRGDGAVSLAGGITFTGLTASKPVFTDASKALTSTGTLSVDQGGTGATTLTDGGILLGSGTGAITALGVATNGQIPIGDGTTDPVLANITGTVNQVTVTDGAGTITLSTPQDLGTSSAVQFGSVNINALVYWSSATAEADEGSVVLPTITANYSGHGFVRVSSAGVIQDSAEFESGSDGNVSLIRGTANVVVGAACADTKICVSTAAGQNPITVQARNGAGQLEIEFWYK